MIKKRWLQVLLFVVVFGVIFWVYFSDLKNHTMHSDEHEWVRRGVVFSELYFIDNNFSDPVWGMYESRDMPKLGEYTLGLWLRVKYDGKVSDLFEKTNYSADWKRYLGYGKLWDEKNWWVKSSSQQDTWHTISEEYKSAYQIIVSARMISVVMGVLGLVMLFIIIRSFLGDYWGLLVVLLLSSNGIFFEIIRQALLDSQLFFWMMLSYLVSSLLNKKKIGKMPGFVDIVVMAIVFGFSANIKLNGIVFWICSVLTSIWISIKGRTTILNVGNRRLMGRLVLVSVLIFGWMWLLNPFLWKNPIIGLGTMLNTRIRITQGQMIQEWSNPLGSYASRVIYVVESYLNSSALSSRSVSIKWFELVLLVLGMVKVLFNKTRNEAEQRFVVWHGILFICVVLYLAVGINRHALILFPTLAVLEIIGLVFLSTNALLIYKYIKVKFNRVV